VGALLSTRALAVLAFALLVGGCASPANRDSMVASVAPARTIAATVSVTTRGGGETDPLAVSGVADADLKAAIETSIAQARLFRGVVQAPGGDYALTVFITQVVRPTFGASMTVQMEAGWNLARASDKAVAMRRSVKSTYTAPASAAFAGVERVRLALEGAVRENIRIGLEAIAALEL
jgi:hypothetical protein